MKKIMPTTLLIFVIFFSLSHFTVFANSYYRGFLHVYEGKTYMMVPARGVFEKMGAEVKWIDSTQKVEIKKDDLNIVLHIDDTKAVVNNNIINMPVSAIIKNGTTFLPLRFLAEIIGDNKVNWDENTQTALIPYGNSNIVIKAVDYDAKIESINTKIKGITVRGLKIPSNSPYKPAVILANNQIGTSQNLYDMAKNNNAIAAINGTFFSAYNSTPDPWNTIIKSGKLIHVGNQGTVFGFTADGKVKMEKLRIKIEGGTSGSYSWPNNWYAYGFNHTPDSNGVYIFTPEWGRSLGFNQGINIVVKNGIVKYIKENQDVNIPDDGYVINLTGTEGYLKRVFAEGKAVEYRIVYTDVEGNKVDWSDVVEAVGAGPTLVRNGELSVDPVAEGFTEEKILSLSFARSAIGVTTKGDILLVTVPSATVIQLGEVMKELGANNAMNLDGGASSGLYFQGKNITTPGRNLSNILIFY